MTAGPVTLLFTDLAELAEAEGQHDLGRIERCREEIDGLCSSSPGRSQVAPPRRTGTARGWW